MHLFFLTFCLSFFFFLFLCSSFLTFCLSFFLSMFIDRSSVTPPESIYGQGSQRLRANAGFSWRRVFPDSDEPPLADDMDVQALT